MQISTFFAHFILYNDTGDIMKKFIFPIFSAIILGYLCANYVLALYENVDSEDNIIYFLQVGAYKNKDSSVDEFKSLNNKLTVKEDDKYYTYIGITSSLKQAEMIKEVYKNNNIEVYIKEKVNTNSTFQTELEQYDILLKNRSTFNEINSVLETVLATYEEEVLNNI